MCDNTVDTMTYSLEVGSNALSELDLNGSLLTVYPIPSTDVLHVQFNQATSDVALELVDLSGRVVASTSKTVLTDNMLDLDMTHLVNGQYILSVSFTNGTQAIVSKTKVQKF